MQSSLEMSWKGQVQVRYRDRNIYYDERRLFSLARPCTVTPAILSIVRSARNA